MSVADERVRAEQLVDRWLMDDFFEPTRVEVVKWLQEEKYAEIHSRLSGCNKLAFGTAGLRARMGAGFDRMNTLTVMQTTQGLCSYLESLNGQSQHKMEVVIGFDGRHNSESFAHVAAAVFVSRGVKVNFIGKPTPTPLTPFLVARTDAVCGIQITASHNPKWDNGYKLFWANGAQIIPPIDSAVAESIERNREVWLPVMKALDPVTARLRPEILSNSDLFADVTEETLAEYLRVITADLTSSSHTNGESKIKFAYTAMHGVGCVAFQRLFASFGFDLGKSLALVRAQAEIDPEFSTVAFPNPEERGALKLAMQVANENGCSVILANDPDADRFTSAERQRDGEWYQFTGDELGLLFADWQSMRFSKSAAGNPGQVGLMVSSVVSSRMVEELCRVRSGGERGKLQYSDCLTGFKWIANESIRLRSGSGVKHLLGYEEAIGYQLSAEVPDKDGLSAACVWAEMCTYWKENGDLSMKERLEQILKSEIGFFVTNNGYYTIDDKRVTEAVFADFRAAGMKQLGPFGIRRVRDVTNGTDTGVSGKSHLPATPEAEMITMFFENGAVVTVRASGTEPKVKFYAELKSSVSREDAKEKLDEVVRVVKRDFYQPHRYLMKEQPIM